MAIQVDGRIGSLHYLELLRARGLPAEVAVLPFGDISFLGAGPQGRPVTVGIEVKTVGDLLRCIADGRFAGGQLTGMQACYEQPWLLVEGPYRPAANGDLEVPTGRGTWGSVAWGRRVWLYRQVEQWLLTMRIRGGMQVVRCYQPTETVAFLHSLYSWWTQGLESHVSHCAFNDSGVFVDPISRLRITHVAEIARTFEGIGDEKALVIGERFLTPEAFFNATEAELQEVAGVGKKLASDIWRELHSSVAAAPVKRTTAGRKVRS